MPAEAGLVARLALASLTLAVVATLWPRVIAWPLAAIGVWFGLSWIVKAVELGHEERRSVDGAAEQEAQALRNDEPE